MDKGLSDFTKEGFWVLLTCLFLWFLSKKRGFMVFLSNLGHFRFIKRRVLGTFKNYCQRGVLQKDDTRK